MNAIRSPAELYAHAIALESEAAERYAEFAVRMRDLGNDEVAALFDYLAGEEGEHLATLKRRTEGVELPPLEAKEYRWLDAAAPETGARELVFRLMTPRQALAIALDAERRAHRFFSAIRCSSADPALRSLAQEMEMEEAAHIQQVLERMKHVPPPPDWAAIYQVGNSHS